MQDLLSSMARTQIYLSTAQQTALGQLSQERKVPKSELIRQALDQWLIAQQPSALSKLEMLQKIKGMWKDRTDLVDSVAHVQALRAGGQRQAVLEQAWGREG